MTDEIQYRLANEGDYPQLAEMRWDFRMEDGGEAAYAKEDFIAYCADFFAGSAGDWAVWIAVQGETILSQIFIQKVRKVPKPAILEEYFGYMTNVYTHPAHRNQGIGSQLMHHVLDWARVENLELLLVWPSDESVAYYRRAGFAEISDGLQLEIRPYIE